MGHFVNDVWAKNGLEAKNAEILMKFKEKNYTTHTHTQQYCYKMNLNQGNH